MDNFFSELKRRHIYRVGAGYVVVAWVLAQGVDLLSQIFQLPSWIAQPAIIVLAAGLPISLVITWVIESKPQEAIAKAVHSKTTSVDWALFGIVAVLVALTGYQQIVLSPVAPASLGIEAERTTASSPATALSIAVLPFVNLSSDKEQEFFSDGVTQEIITTLAKIPDLRIVARESATQFKDKPIDMRVVGRQLGATHLIEGSVRRDGSRVRITAELIKSDDGVAVWTDRYDREMTDVFAIQEEIATAIAGALRMPLGLKPGEHLVPNRSIDPESYVQFLRGKAALLTGRSHFADMIAILEPLVAHSPNYAPAWSALAQAYFFATTNYEIEASQAPAPTELLRLRDTYNSKLDAATRRAVELDPNSVDGLITESVAQVLPRKWALSEAYLAQALALDPNHPQALEFHSNVLYAVGRIKEALAEKQQLHELEPLVAVYSGNYAEALWLGGQTDASIAVLKEIMGRSGGGGAARDLARVYASIGKYGEAADSLAQFSGSRLVSSAVQLLRSAPSAVAAPDTLPRLGNLGFIYLYVGAPERALDYYEEARPSVSDVAVLWHPSYAAVRKTERFKKVLRAQGLVDYWRAKGWPDLCRPVGKDDFVCD